MNKSDTLRDRLADVLLEGLEDRNDPETGERVPPDPRVLAVARAFVKDNPPEDVVTAESTSGLLAEHIAGLPFVPKLVSDGS